MIYHNRPKCPATTPTWSCAVNNPAYPSAVSATNATANAPCAIPTCVPRPSSASATSAHSAITRTSASSAVVKASVTRFTASSVRAWRRIGMGVLRLLIWVVRGRICFTRKRVFGIIDAVVCGVVVGCRASRVEFRGPVAPGLPVYVIP